MSQVLPKPNVNPWKLSLSAFESLSNAFTINTYIERYSYFWPDLSDWSCPKGFVFVNIRLCITL